MSPGRLAFKAPSRAVAFIERRYDALGRAVRFTQSDRSFSTIEYEPFARLVRDEEQTKTGSMHAGAARRFIVDGLWGENMTGRLREVHEIVKLTDAGRQRNDSSEWKTRYDYDPLDNVVSITDAQRNRKLAEFDGLSRKVLDDDPNRGAMVYVYDDASNLVETTDAKRQRIKYEYDGANRLVSETYHDEATPAPARRDPDVRYVYDRPASEPETTNGSCATPRNTLGRLVSVLDLSGESHRSYDARARVECHVKGIPHPQTGIVEFYASSIYYDSLDRVTSLVYPDNDRVTYSYNSRGLLERIAVGNKPILANLDYSASGQFARMDHANGVSTTYEYDGLSTVEAADQREAGRSTVALIRLPLGQRLQHCRDRRPANDGRPSGNDAAVG